MLSSEQSSLNQDGVNQLRDLRIVSCQKCFASESICMGQQGSKQSHRRTVAISDDCSRWLDEPASSPRA